MSPHSRNTENTAPDHEPISSAKRQLAWQWGQQQFRRKSIDLGIKALVWRLDLPLFTNLTFFNYNMRISVLHTFHGCWRWNVVWAMWKCLMRSFLTSPWRGVGPAEQNRQPYSPENYVDYTRTRLNNMERTEGSTPIGFQRERLRVGNGETSSASVEQRDGKSEELRSKWKGGS